MAKPEWGQKRTCTSCGCRFYDLTRTPIVCPKCGATVEPDVPFKVRRDSAAAVAAAEKAAAAAPVRDIVEADADDLPLDDEDEAAEGDEDAEDEMIEDASDLGEDDDDMAEVMEHMDEEIEDEV